MLEFISYTVTKSNNALLFDIGETDNSTSFLQTSETNFKPISFLEDDEKSF